MSQRPGDKGFENLTFAQQLATVIHDRSCHDNHTDACGWFYEEWTTMHPMGTKRIFLDIAARRIAELTIHDQAILALAVGSYAQAMAMKAGVDAILDKLAPRWDK